MQDMVVALLLLLGANGAPVLATRVLGERFDRPLDGGQRMADGDFVLGPHKTVRGLLAALVASTALAPLLGVPAPVGTLVGATAMVGDAFSSFLKRRRHLGSGDRASVLDQLPEALLPLFVLQQIGHLDLIGLAVVALAFLLLSALLSRVLFTLGIRKRPY